jgi:hypothetical protein
MPFATCNFSLTMALTSTTLQPNQGTNRTLRLQIPGVFPPDNVSSPPHRQASMFYSGNVLTKVLGSTFSVVTKLRLKPTSKTCMGGAASLLG